MKRSPFHSIIFLVGLLFIVSVSCNFGNRQIEPTAPQQPDIESPSSATTESLSTEQPPTETPLPTEQRLSRRSQNPARMMCAH
jgi:hypothetical protein